jgi:hypothetical protein
VLSFIDYNVCWNNLRMSTLIGALFLQQAIKSSYMPKD